MLSPSTSGLSVDNLQIVCLFEVFCGIEDLNILFPSVLSMYDMLLSGSLLEITVDSKNTPAMSLHLSVLINHSHHITVSLRSGGTIASDVYRRRGYC